MKALTIALALFLTSAAQANTAVIATMKTAGGLMAPGHSNTYTLDVMKNGQVLASSPEQRDVLVATLAPATLERLIAKIESLPNSITLVKEKPDSPMCFDAPSTTFSVVKSNGKKIAVGAVSQCLDYVPSEFIVSAYEIVKFLRGLKSLTIL